LCGRCSKCVTARLSCSNAPPADGRRLFMGWMSNWLYANVEPTSPWRGVQSVPRELSLRRGPEGIRLVQAPVRELLSLRLPAEPLRVAGETALPGGAEIELEVAPGTW